VASQKAALAAGRAAADGAQVKNSTKVERRVRPVWWGDHLPGFVPNFVSGSAGNASVRYSPGKLFARATAMSPDKKGALESLVGATDDTFSADVSVGVEVPPDALLIATRDGDRIVLTGEVGSQDEAAAIEGAVSASMPGAEIVNRLEVVSPRSELPNLANLAATFPVLFAPAVQAPRLTARGAAVTLEGSVSAAEAKQGIGSKVGELFAGMRSPENLVAVASPPEPEPAAKSLAGQLESLAVYFNTSSAYIGAKEQPKIAKAAKLLSDSGSSRLIVGGYADLRGIADSNRELSLERANAVRAKLVELGVPADRMTVQHFGEDTSEVKAADLWKSRRVQISITPDSQQ